jgi:hypothetical protein
MENWRRLSPVPLAGFIAFVGLHDLVCSVFSTVDRAVHETLLVREMLSCEVD